MLQYSIADMLIVITLAALIISLGMWLGVWAVVLALWVAALHITASLLRHRLRRVLLTIAVMLMLLPCLGVSGYSHAVPGYDLQLPTVHWPELEPGLTIFGGVFRFMYTVLNGLYRVGATPLEIIAVPSLGLSDVIFFSNSGTVRPFAVFVFWSCSALAFAMPDLYRKKKG